MPVNTSFFRVISCSVILSVLFVTGCHSDMALENALKFAEGNRKEIEKVLAHYSKEPADSLKYRAACFLIRNMPDYWYYEGDQISKFRKEMYRTAIDNKCEGKEAFLHLQKKYGVFDIEKCTRVYDLQVITADYLINNIELSFKVWKERPWGKHISFEDFCEEILPYRVGHEPLDDWRQHYYDSFRAVIDSLPAECREDPVAACQFLCNIIHRKPWIFFQFNPVTGMGANNLLSNRFGSCDDRGELATYAMRALGIPGGIDGVIHYPNRMYGHSWNYVRDTSGRTVDYELYERIPGAQSTIVWKKGKVYRMRFGKQEHSLPVYSKATDLPPGLDNQFLTDVSEAYFKGAVLAITPDRKDAEADVIYLSTFNNRDWLPDAWSAVQETKAVFKDVEGGIVYLPSYWKDGKAIPAAYPVLIDSNAAVHFFTPDLKHRQTMKVTRKYPVQPWWDWYKKRSLGGRFQVSNESKFAHAVTVYTVPHEHDMSWHNIDVSIPGSYRYVRYLTGIHGYCNMAEVEVYADNELLKGEIIGTTGTYANDSVNTRNAVFDGNPLTFYDANDSSKAWAGMDLGKARNITKINYLFRNDDNNIRLGDNYELFYWDNKWVSLGKQVARSSVLTFENCPVNAIYLLHNSSRGMEERIFSYVQDQQIWW